MKVSTHLGMIFVLALQLARAQTGAEVPSLAGYDQFMTGFLNRHGIPGGALAITRNGQLVFARGYGFADQEARTPVQPDSLFRIASLSKVVTSVAVMRLVEEGKLGLDQPAFALLPLLQPPPGTMEDPRLGDITIRHLLEHSGGWDKEMTFDPMYQSPIISAALGVPAPVSTENVIRAMRTQPLQFTPGSRSAYSNFGYAVLGRIIDRVSGMSYEQYVRTNVLAPMGISEMRLGNTLAHGRLPKEVKYYFSATGPSVFPDTPDSLPLPYGGWSLDSKDAPGGWVSSVIDYAKFLNGIDGRRGRRLLSPESVAAMTARPNLAEYKDAQFWYGFGLMVRPIGSGANWWHNGGTDGTLTMQTRTASGYTWVVFFNSSPADEAARGVLLNEVDRGLADAFVRITAWPTSDQFANYPDVTPQMFSARPAISTREGVVNAATLDRGIVSGSWLSIFGVNLAPTARTWRGDEIVSGRLPTALDGVSVRINGQAAALYSISPAQINAQAPAGLTPGWVTVEVTRDGVSSGIVLAHAKQNAPGAFAYEAGGRRLASATGADGTLLGDPAVTPGTRAAVPGETIVIYGTGLAPSAAGVLVTSPQAVGGVAVEIGGRPATVSFAGVVGAGLFQVNAVVPELAGGFHSVGITVNGSRSLGGVLIPVRR